MDSSGSKGSLGVRNEQRGSTTIEGIVAMGVFFLLIALVVQLGFLVIARSAVGASLDASVRRLSEAEADTTVERDRLVYEIGAVAPGMTVLSVDLARSSAAITITAVVEWIPPGPDLLPVRLAITRSHALVVPP